MSVPEPEENMVGCQSYTKWCIEDEQSVVDLLDDQVQPGEQLLVVHLDKVGPVKDLLKVFLMTPIPCSTAPIPSWCLGKVTLNSI